MNSFEKKLALEISPLFAEATPSLQIGVWEKGRKRAQLQFGQDYRFYDLASLTKIIFTTTSWMQRISQFPKELQSNLGHHFKKTDWKKVLLSDVLSHNAGMTWWKPYYLEIDPELSRDNRILDLKQKILLEKPHLQPKAIYSDLDFLIAGFFLNDLTQKDWSDNFEKIRDGFDLEEVRFHPENKPFHKVSLYAPTENCPWRKKVLQGEAHDENTWALGGVAPHAGLFGDLEGAGQWILKLRKILVNDRAAAGIQPKILKKFITRAIPKERGDWALGWMMPTKGSASCGSLMSLKSVGHTGFTGTSIWWDPTKDLIIVILSNRIYPTRENKKFVQLRPQLHDLIMSLL